MKDPGTGARPTIADGAWVAPGAVVVGDVTIEAEASIWYGCVLRGDIAPIRIGPRTNIQDLTMVHVDVERPCRVGADVGVGHRAILHGCDIEDGCLVGMGAVVLSHAVVGAGSVIGAGALVKEGFVVPPGSLVLGVPGRVAGPVSDVLRSRMAATIDHYSALRELHASGRWQPPG